VTCGIYRIEIGPWFYFGSAAYFPRRKAQHLHNLKTGKHPNILLQRAYDKYNEFTMYLVDPCTPNALLIREQYFLDSFVGSNKCANIAKNAEFTWLGKLHTETSKEKISDSRKGKCLGESNHFWGKTHSAETKKKISASRKGKTSKGCHPMARKICVTSCSGSCFVFDTGRSLSSFLQKSPAFVCKLLKGQGKMPYGVKSIEYLS
jgi:group I intron endonuclease